MEIVLSRTDERLIHGEIINEWCQFIKPTVLLIADDELVEDSFMSNVYCALAPVWLETQICSVSGAVDYINSHKEDTGRIFLLCRNPVSFVQLVKQGLNLSEISLADKRYFHNKIEIPLACRTAINELIDMGVTVQAQLSPENEPELLEKYEL